MTQQSILGKCKLVAFAATTDFAKARAFYEGVLGLRLVEDQQPFALVFDANGTMLRVTSGARTQSCALHRVGMGCGLD